jgi:YVTN family beta-propeller protein
VVAFDLAKGKVSSVYPLPKEPTGMALVSDEKLLYVSAGGADGTVIFLDLKFGKIIGSIDAGHTPIAPVVSPDGKTLYVCNRFNNEVMIVDLASRKVTGRVPVTREPVAALITPDGKSLFVANQLPAGAANGSRMTSVIDVVDTPADGADGVNS